jgi:hypothetical protein
MKENLFLFISVIILGATSFLGAPWWIIAPLSAVAAFFLGQTAGSAYAIAFSAGALLWYGAAMLSNVPNAGLLATKVGQVFQGLKSWQLLVITGMLGGLLGGFGALTGVYFRGLFTPSKTRRYRGAQIKI